MEKISFKLEVFEGPLDLLLSLIQKNKVNIYDIPIALITEQYFDYIRQMHENDLEVSSEFIVMAARLLYIKSKLLLPKHEEVDEEEEDPRQELILTLVEYKKYKEVSKFFGDRKNICDYIYFKKPGDGEKFKINVNPDLDIDRLTEAFKQVMIRAENRLSPSKIAFSGIVGKDPVPVKSKISSIKRILSRRKQVSFDDLFIEAESKSEIVAIFLAVLELVRNSLITVEFTKDDIIVSGGETDGIREDL